MMGIYMKDRIDMELSKIRFTSDMENKVKCALEEKRVYGQRGLKLAAYFMAVFMMTGVSVLAGHIVLDKIAVNKEILPELERMQVVEIKEIIGVPDKFGYIEKHYDSYDKLKEEVQLSLLDSKLAVENPYMQAKMITDNEDTAIICVENYILGDTGNFEMINGSIQYRFEPGEEYFSPVSLEAHLVLNKEQLDGGWEISYYGDFKYVETFKSSQGYTVNILQETLPKESEKSYDIPEKAFKKFAIFVVDGIRYTISVGTSVETLKEIVNSMEY